MRKLLLTTAAAISLIAGSALAQSFNEYLTPTSPSAPYSIAAGPDGALWITEFGANKIGRLITSGDKKIGSITGAVVFQEYTIPTASSAPVGITVGPDGNLWFVEQNGNNIGKITPLGVITEYAIPTAASGSSYIAAGPDGALWFTETQANKIGRITTSGAFTEYVVPTAGSLPMGIAAGQDNALWFAENLNSGSKIGRISTSGTITEYTTPTTISQPYGVAAGPDGAVWFTEQTASQIGRITTGVTNVAAGVITEYPIFVNARPQGIMLGPDGAMYFTTTGGVSGPINSNFIGRATTDGVTALYPIPSPSGPIPLGMTIGPDGAIWFAENAVDQIGRLTTK